VILCETCALEFYDVLIKKIVKFEATFEEFLLEQQEKEGGKESPTRVQSPARRPGNAGAASIASPTERGSQHGNRAPQHGDRAPRQRPGTSSERRRPDTTSALASAGAARPRATPGEVPNSPSTPSRDDMIVTRGESKGGLSGFLDPRRRPGRQGPRPAGGKNSLTAYLQALSTGSRGKSRPGLSAARQQEITRALACCRRQRAKRFARRASPGSAAHYASMPAVLGSASSMCHADR